MKHNTYFKGGYQGPLGEEHKAILLFVISYNNNNRLTCEFSIRLFYYDLTALIECLTRVLMYFIC